MAVKYNMDEEPVETPLPTQLSPHDMAQAPEAPLDPQASLQQLLSLMQQYRDVGLIAQRSDGSFMFPGQKDVKWEERVQVGSSCACPACTPHNQRHWICMVCYQPHEWVMQADRPLTMRTQLGSGGKEGFVHLVDSNACALEYRRRMGQGQGVAHVPGMEQGVPFAGPDDADPTQFFQGVR